MFARDPVHHPPPPAFAASVCASCVSPASLLSLSAASQHRWLALTLPHRHTPFPPSTHSAADPALSCCRVHAAAHVEPTAAAHRPGPRLRPRPHLPPRPRTCCCASLRFLLKRPVVASERHRPRSLSSPVPGSPILAASTLFQPNLLLFDTACCVLPSTLPTDTRPRRPEPRNPAGESTTPVVRNRLSTRIPVHRHPPNLEDLSRLSSGLTPWTAAVLHAACRPHETSSPDCAARCFVCPCTFPRCIRIRHPEAAALVC